MLKVGAPASSTTTMQATKYPPLTDDLTVFVPQKEMRHRVLLPSDFDAQLIMEDPMIPFVYSRNFLVMTNRGLRHKELTGRCAYPRVTPEPKEQRRHMLKIVDMISCTAMHDRNETCTLVRVRWQNLDWTDDTWVLTSRVQNTALLQQFYVGASSSWHTSHLVTTSARHRYASEEKLWDEEPAIANWKREHGIIGNMAPDPSSNAAPPGPPPPTMARPRPGVLPLPSYPPTRRPDAPPQQVSFHYPRYGDPKDPSPTAAEMRTAAAKQQAAALLSSKHAFAQDSLGRSVSTSATSHATGNPRPLPRRHSDNSSLPSSDHPSRPNTHRRVVYNSSSSPRRSVDSHRRTSQPRLAETDSQSSRGHPWQDKASRHHNGGHWGSSARTVVDVSERRRLDSDDRRQRGDGWNKSKDEKTSEADERPTKRVRLHRDTSPSTPSTEAAPPDKKDDATGSSHHRAVQDRLAILADRRLKRQRDSETTHKPAPSSNASASQWQIPKRQPPDQPPTAQVLPSKYDKPQPDAAAASTGWQDHGMSPPREESPPRASSPTESTENTALVATAPSKYGPDVSRSDKSSQDVPVAPSKHGPDGPQDSNESTRSSHDHSSTSSAISSGDNRSSSPPTAPTGSTQPSDQTPASGGELPRAAPSTTPKTTTGWGDLPPTKPTGGWGDLPPTKPSGGWGSPRRSSSGQSRASSSSRSQRPPTPSNDSWATSTSPRQDSGRPQKASGWGGLPSGGTKPASGWGDLPLSGPKPPSSGGWGAPSHKPPTLPRRVSESSLPHPSTPPRDPAGMVMLQRRTSDSTADYTASMPPLSSKRPNYTPPEVRQSRSRPRSDAQQMGDAEATQEAVNTTESPEKNIQDGAGPTIPSSPAHDAAIHAEKSSAADEQPPKAPAAADAATPSSEPPTGAAEGPTAPPTTAASQTESLPPTNAFLASKHPPAASEHRQDNQEEPSHHDSIVPDSQEGDDKQDDPLVNQDKPARTPAPKDTPPVKIKLEPVHPMWRPYTLPRSAIRCLCGAKSAEDYTGEWIQCWTEACGKWFHVTCVPSATFPYYCASCTGVSVAGTYPPPPTNQNLYLYCQTNSRRAFRASMDLLPIKSTFLRYKSPADHANGVVMAAKVGAKAILEEMMAVFTPAQVKGSANALNQTPLHVAILHRNFHCLAVLTLLQPHWFQVPDVYSALPIDYLLQLQPAQVVPLLQDRPELVEIVNPATGNSLAHAVCALLPPNFASLLALVPPSLLAASNHHGQTPAMVLMQTPSVQRSHFQALVQHSAAAATGAQSWWTHVDDQGRTVLHLALTYKHVWALELVDLSEFREFRLLHMAAELGLASAVALLVAADFSPRTQDGSTSGASTGWWPILHAATPSCVLELLRTDACAQLEYLYQNSQAHSAKVSQILNSIASYLPLYDFVQATALANPELYLTGRCQFLQRFRKCLRLDLKFVQLQHHVASIPTSHATPMTVHIKSEESLWTCIQSQCQNMTNWRRPFEFKVQSVVISSIDPHLWSVLASQLRKLGSHLFDAPPSVFGLLGRLLGHMVFVGQRLPSAVLPPPFLSTPAEYKPDLAPAFKAGFDSVLQGALDNWNGYERFLLLHKVVFPQTLTQWKASHVAYDAPFHPRHPTIVSFWKIVETCLVPEEQLVCRLRCGLPLRLTPAATVGIVEKSVFGLPDSISLDKLHVDLVLYIRGFRKQVKQG